jgi:hypothetical protein
MEEAMSTAKSVMAESRNQQLSYGFFCAISVLIWLSGTLALRLWGQIFFIPNNNLSMAGSFLFSLLFLPTLIYGIFRWQGVQPHQRQEATICLTIPSMFLDVLTVYFFTQIFPNLLPTVARAFGAWLLWGYTIVLVTGLMTSKVK